MFLIFSLCGEQCLITKFEGGRENAVWVLGVQFLSCEPPKHDMFKVRRVSYLFVILTVLLNSVTYHSV